MPAAALPQNPLVTASWMQRTLTGPMGAATSSPTPMPASPPLDAGHDDIHAVRQVLSPPVDLEGWARALRALGVKYATVAVEKWAD